jgi:hypothetical protein
MEENFDALQVIASTRGKVDMDKAPTGENIFLLWGLLTSVFFLLQFVLWECLHQPWCMWVWLAAVLIGWPWMIVLIHRDHDRTHRRTHESKIILNLWIFIGASCAVGGLALGFADLFESLAMPLIGLLIGIGAFVSGQVIRFRPKTIGGIIGATIGMLSFTLQDDLWNWQMLTLSLTSVAALVIPGFLYKKSIRNGV